MGNKMPSLSRKASFRSSTKNLQSTQTLFESCVRNEIERIDPTVDMESIDKFIHALKIIDSNDNFTNIKQEDLPRLFVELDLPIGGHDIRKKISDRKIKLESTKPISLEIIVDLFLEIKKEKEENDGKM